MLKNEVSEMLPPDLTKRGEFPLMGRNRHHPLRFLNRCCDYFAFPSIVFMPTRFSPLSSRGRHGRALVLNLLAAIVLAATFRASIVCAKEPPSTLLTHVPALPLAIDSAFEFRKTKLYLLDTEVQTGVLRPPQEPSLAFERRRLLYGAITGSDIRDRYGNYFTFFWRAKRRANLTLRLEYRQRKLGPYLLAREIEYPDAQGSFTSHFQVTGDDYAEQGGVVQWRAVLIEDHRVIVGLTQSYLWR